MHTSFSAAVCSIILKEHLFMHTQKHTHEYTYAHTHTVTSTHMGVYMHEYILIYMHINQNCLLGPKYIFLMFAILGESSI